jgi:outer membrane scaffolding protein for murein synthesis (MipA/OmpV family)
VPGKDERANRREYDAPGGFLGYDHAISFMYRIKDLRIFFGLVYSDYREAMVENSPLFKNAENTISFIGFSYIFSKSKSLEK